MKTEAYYAKLRAALIEELRIKGQVIDEAVLKAISLVPRHHFVPKELCDRAYENTALPIGKGQTISQPYIVAAMTAALCQGRKLDSVLEIGTGTGYQAAVLSSIVKTVYSVERIETLAIEAEKRLKNLSVKNVQIEVADGFLGWQKFAPYQGILVTASPEKIPPELLLQLADEGVMVIPVGEPGDQRLVRLTRRKDHIQQEFLEFVRFVPLLPGTE